eukprot:snap_masked-scaffold_1-processed-gene-11.11-mRNA-1 protein AED:1.00 eAED:1.00 QI:0/0/0/0/1/1/2/0/61
MENMFKEYRIIPFELRRLLLMRFCWIVPKEESFGFLCCFHKNNEAIEDFNIRVETMDAQLY